MIYEEIRDSVPSSLNKLEIARYLYLKCGLSFCFDTKINNTECSTFYQLLNEEINPTLFDRIQINCFTWSQIYSSLLNEFEIDNKIIKYWHSYVNFFIDDVRWVADATYGKYSDLSRIQYGDRTSFFGPCLYDWDSNAITNNKDYILMLDHIDDKLGYLGKNNILNFKELLCFIKDDDIYKYISCDGDIVVSKLKFIFSHVGCLSFGYYEAKEFVFGLEKILLSDSELKRVSSIELVRKNSINEIDILQCICVNTGSDFVYFIICPNLPIYQIYPDDFSSLFYLGFIPKGPIPGINQSCGFPSSNFKDLSRYDFIQAKTKKLDYGNP